MYAYNLDIVTKCLVRFTKSVKMYLTYPLSALLEVVVPDVHGDLDVLRAALALGGVLSECAPPRARHGGRFNGGRII